MVDTVDAEDGIQIAAVVVESLELAAEHKAAQKVQRNRAVFDPSIMHRKNKKHRNLFII